VFDLLNGRKKLNILEDGKKQVCVVGLKVRRRASGDGGLWRLLFLSGGGQARGEPRMSLGLRGGAGLSST
jgi:hypothetical protein